ncbi:MAG: hypothetical protein HND53_01525 [Proteobacteria bacterium]|nr:hypothetical protein [Pseudomonadota bacterium]
MSYPREREHGSKQTTEITRPRLWLLRRSTDYIHVVEVRQKIRFLHYSRKAEQAYVQWICRFIL